MKTPSDCGHSVTAASLTLTLALLASLPLGAAQPPVQDPDAFEEIGVYLLRLDGEAAPARFFHSSGRARILMLSPELSHGVELDPRSRSILLYSASDYDAKPDGTRARQDDAAVVGRGSFELEGKLPKFAVEGRQAQVLLKPPLLGETDRDGILAYDMSYGDRGEPYRAHPQHLERIRSHQDPIRVRVFFGSWCSLCYQVLPNILKLESELAGSAVEFEYYGLPQGAQDPEAQKLGVDSVPTGIVYRDGEEIGRIKGVRWRYPGMSLSNALGGIGSRRIGGQPPG